MALLIHLDGAPGVGKSTIAQRYVAEHPGVAPPDRWSPALGQA